MNKHEARPSLRWHTEKALKMELFPNLHKRFCLLIYNNWSSRILGWCLVSDIVYNGTIKQASHFVTPILKWGIWLCNFIYFIYAGQFNKMISVLIIRYNMYIFELVVAEWYLAFETRKYLRPRVGMKLVDNCLGWWTEILTCTGVKCFPRVDFGGSLYMRRESWYW